MEKFRFPYLVGDEKTYFTATPNNQEAVYLTTP